MDMFLILLQQVHHCPYAGLIPVGFAISSNTRGCNCNIHTILQLIERSRTRIKDVKIFNNFVVLLNSGLIPVGFAISSNTRGCNCNIHTILQLIERSRFSREKFKQSSSNLLLAVISSTTKAGRFPIFLSHE
ncbi:hypothetical protein L2E82_10596 [Cichorium intybus]|uniref:Uncharacterized protein n=1 Tax=Cichorium intybus TaxID=13427 RepID=A0ACB9GC78_CICIN|nr:hypothetical protein L2E82_10596 [Cichorium intybus]